MGKKGFYTRLRALNSNILHPLSYIYYPQQLMPDPSIAIRLRSNTQKLMHTTWVHKTIHGIISRTFATKVEEGGHEVLPLGSAPRGCITGMDLAKVDVPENRVVISWNLFSSKKRGEDVQGALLGAVHQGSEPVPSEAWSKESYTASGKE